MQQDLFKLDDQHDRRVLTMGSTDEANIYRRCYIGTADTLTHRLVITWLDPLHVELRPEQLPLIEIASKTNGFMDLSVPDLRALAKANNVDVSGHTNSVLTGDKEALAANLMTKAKADADAEEATKQQPADNAAPSEPVIPPEVRNMTDADLETRAVELGIKTGKGWSKQPRVKREVLVATAQS
jgi:hypothetical protein